MYKRIIAWVVVLAILGFFTYQEYEKSIAPNPEEIVKETLNIYTDIDGYEENIKKEIRSEVTNRYNLNFVKASDAKTADVVLTEDTTNLDFNREYETMAYSPMVIMIRNDDRIEKYSENGLLIKKEDENEAEIDFKKIMDAVSQNKNWSYFGGESKPIKVYCPQKGTCDAELFYQFLLITANDGVYPTTQGQKAKCEKIANEFLASPMVEEVDIVSRAIKVQDIEDDIYVMPEAYYFDVYGAIKKKEVAFIAYPTKTVIKEIYYQISETDAGKSFDKEFDEERFFVGSLRLCLIGRTQYRSTNAPGAQNKYSTNAKDAFDYIEIPKEIKNSVSTE